MRILLVEDDIPTLARYEIYISEELREKIATSSDADGAVEMVKRFPICVAVLDEKLGTDKGTELFPKLQRIRPHIKALMLTAGASKESLIKAMQRKYSGYLDKKDIKNVPEEIRKLLGEYYLEIQARNLVKVPVVLYQKKHRLFRHPLEEISLISAYLEEENSFEGNDWKEIISLQAGESYAVKRKSLLSGEKAVEMKASAQIRAAMGISEKKYLKIEASIKTALSTEISLVEKAIWSSETEVVQHIALTPRPEDPNKEFVARTVIQECQTYTTYRVELRLLTSENTNSIIEKTLVKVLSTKRAIRQIDYLSNGTDREMYLGLF